MRLGRAYSRAVASHRTASSAAGAPRHAPMGRRAVCIGTSPGISALRWLGWLCPPAGQGAHSIVPASPPVKRPRERPADAPERLTISAPDKNMYRRSRAMFRRAGGPEKFAPRGEAGERIAGEGWTNGSAEYEVRST